MKKILIGCLIILVVIVGLVIGGVWYGYTKLKSFAGSYDESIAQVQEIDRDFPWTAPPAGTALTADRFNDYLLVRTRINDRLMRVGLFSELASAAEQERNANITAFQIMGLFTEIPGVLKDSVSAFRDNRMSFREFSHHSYESLRAIRAGAQAGDPEMAALWEKLRGMANFMDAQLNQDGTNTNIDISGTFETLSSYDAPPETVNLVRSRLSEFDQAPARYMIELIFIRFLDETGSRTQ